MDNLRPAQLDSPLNRRVRVFLGIGPASREWSEPLSLWIAQLARRFPEGIRWTAPENLHITLRFFGSVDQEEVLSISEAVEKATLSHSRFQMQAQGLECFPNARQPRILAVKMLDESATLIDLEENLRAVTSGFGKPPENRTFRPHVTFGRVVAPLGRFEAPNLPALPDWPVESVALFKSELQRGGSIYSVLRRFPLGAT